MHEAVKEEGKSSEKMTKAEIIREIISWVITVLAAFLISLFISHVLLIFANIPSGSMENTIMTKDRVIGNRLSYLASEPKRYDIIIFKYPDNEEELFIKRIIGLPGETIMIVDGKVYVNGSAESLEDDFIKEPMLGSFGPYEVPEGCYFMLGDNRNDSQDSRFWKNPYVSKSKIIGKAVLRYKLFSTFVWLTNDIG